MNIKKAIYIPLIVLFSFFLAGCGKKPETKVTPTPVPKLVEMPLSERPYISLIPRADGHELKLKITGIPSHVKEVEYELIYTAQDDNIEIEKGVGDTVKVVGNSLERDLLLGTSSCTNGCKYKYDNGVTGGTLSLTFSSENGQVSTFETPFSLKSGTDLKKEGGISLTTENFSIKTSSTSKDFYVLLKNYGLPKNAANATGAFSIFSSGNTAVKLVSVTPDTISKSDSSTIAGDYLIK